MKKLFTGFVLCILLFGGFFCVSTYRWWRGSHSHSNKVSLSIRESDDIYQINAYYDPEKTRRVQEYLDETMGAEHTFRNSRVNGTVTLDDRTSFFIHAVPGRISIRFDRDENSNEAFIRMKEFGEGLKGRIISN